MISQKYASDCGDSKMNTPWDLHNKWTLALSRSCAVETGHTFAAETWQMFTAETGQMSLPLRQCRCLLLRLSQLKATKDFHNWNQLKTFTTKDRSLKIVHNYPKTLKTLKITVQRTMHITMFFTLLRPISASVCRYCYYYNASSC